MGRGRSGRVARMSVGVVALMISLSACSTEQWEKAFGFGWPLGITTQAHAIRGLWTWSIDRRARRRRAGLGPDLLGLHRRTAAATPSCPGRPSTTCRSRRSTRWCRSSPWRCCSTTPWSRRTIVITTKPARRHHGLGHRVQVELAVHLRPGQRDPRTDEAVYTVGSTDEIPVAGRPGQRERALPGQLQRRDPLVLGARVRCSSGTSSRPRRRTRTTCSSCGPRSRARTSGAARSSCGTYHSQMNFEMRVVSASSTSATCRRWPRSATTTSTGRRRRSARSGSRPQATTTHPFDTDRTLRAPSEPQANN